MPKINHLIALFLVLGIIYAEILPNITTASSVKAFNNASSPTHSEELLSILQTIQAPVENDPYLNNVAFISGVNPLPDSPESILTELSDIALVNINKSDTDTNASLGTLSQPLVDNLPVVPSPENTPSSTDSSVSDPYIGDVVPTPGTPLFFAYATGGSAWYEENNKVIVQFTEDTFKSYDKFTGEEITWLQDRLNMDAINTPNAIDKYINDYSGKIVAETSTWVLMKFPSGGFLKIVKSQLDTTTNRLTQEPFLVQE